MEALTGNKEDLYDQARFGYYLTALESDTAAGGFFHSDTFVLVDRETASVGCMTAPPQPR